MNSKTQAKAASSLVQGFPAPGRLFRPTFPKRRSGGRSLIASVLQNGPNDYLPTRAASTAPTLATISA